MSSPTTRTTNTWSSSTSPGIGSTRTDSVSWSQKQEEVEITEALVASTKEDLLEQTLASLRLLANDLDKDRWMYE
jgi:hypothetical protein